jgi:hypothetical protein
VTTVLAGAAQSERLLASAHSVVQLRPAAVALHCGLSLCAGLTGLSLVQVTPLGLDRTRGENHVDYQFCIAS